MERFRLVSGFVLVILTQFLLFVPSISASLEPIDPWSVDVSLTQQTANHQTLGIDNYLINFGGATSDDFSLIEKLNTTLILPSRSWTNELISLPQNSYWHSMANKSNRVYLLGGTQYPPQTSKNFSIWGDVDSNGDIFSWTPATPLPQRLSKGASAIVGNYIYFSGGWTDSENAANASKKVYYALINADGSLGTWNTTTDLPDVLWDHGLMTYGNYIYVIGGWNSSGITNQVWRATANSDGTLSTWTAMPNLPVSVRSAGITMVDNYIFVVGGYNGNFLKNVYYTTLSSDGGMTSWQTSANSLPVNHCCGSLAVAGGYLYLTGGYTNGYEDRVWKAKLNVGVPTTLTPTIIIPGMGASWNYEALVHNAAVADTSWTLTPFVTVYDGLITTLKNSGYVENTNLWIYYYDWRKNISNTASNLSGFITSKNLTSVNLIGHSQGGLVARAYVQNNPTKINKLITIASPHTGVLPVYKIWEGADFSDLPAWQDLLIKLFLRINRKSYENDVSTIQSKFPNLQNILPTFEYFSPGTGLKSNYLGMLSTTLLHTISGTDINTPRYYTVTARNSFDKLVGKWVDGKPTSTQNASGDGTVLLTSSQISGEIENLSESGQDHQIIVSNAATLAKIQNILGISGSISTSSQADLGNVIMVTTASPVNFSVKKPDNSIVSSTDNLVVIANPADGNYQVLVTPVGAGGAYTIYFGKLKTNDSAWEEIGGNITSGTNTHTFGLSQSQTSLGSTPINNALAHVNDAYVLVGSNVILKQDVLRIKSYVNDLNSAAANTQPGFDTRASRLFSAINALTAKAKNNSLTQTLRLLKADIEQLRGDRFGN